MDARLRFLLLAATALVLSCVQTDQKIGRDNPLDPGGTNYRPLQDSTVIVRDGLVAWFPFSGNANDQSNSNLRSAVNGATLTSDRFGAANSAYTFNGTTDDIEVADTTAISFANSQSFSISLWLKTTSASTNMMPLLKYQYAVSGGYFFIMNHTAAGFCGGAGIASFVAGVGSPACAASPINDGAWHHLVAEFSSQSDTITLFLDGAAQARTGKPGSDISVAAPLLIGGLPGYYPYAGSVDDVRIYNRVLAAAEIDSLFHEGGWK
jgi:hypothetical protein